MNAILQISNYLFGPTTLHKFVLNTINLFRHASFIYVSQVYSPVYAHYVVWLIFYSRKQVTNHYCQALCSYQISHFHTYVICFYYRGKYFCICILHTSCVYIYFCLWDKYICLKTELGSWLPCNPKAAKFMFWPPKTILPSPKLSFILLGLLISLAFLKVLYFALSTNGILPVWFYSILYGVENYSSS